MHSAALVRSAAFVACLLGLAGCASSIEPRSTRSSGLVLGGSGTVTAPREQAHADDRHPAVCVMEVPGTGIHVDEIDDGVAVVFDTVDPERIAELRRAVRGLVEAYERGRRVVVEHHHSRRGLELARRYRELAGDLPALRALVHDVEGGARLEVRAADPAMVALLRDKMRAEAAVMQRGVCPLAQ